jgi:hypothetical protein
MAIDVTNQVNFQLNDDECLPLTKCVCGEYFEPWKQIIPISPDNPWECPRCHSKLYWSTAIRVYELDKE